MTDKEIKNIYDILADITLVLEKHVKEKRLNLNEKH